MCCAAAAAAAAAGDAIINHHVDGKIFQSIRKPRALYYGRENHTNNKCNRNVTGNLSLRGRIYILLRYNRAISENRNQTIILINTAVRDFLRNTLLFENVVIFSQVHVYIHTQCFNTL